MEHSGLNQKDIFKIEDQLVDKYDNRTVINLMWLFTGAAMIVLSFFLNNII